jgi:hypothetical protein
MAYVEAHAELRNHPKTKKAARALGVHKAQMIGHLLCLWWWCQDYAEDGDLSCYDPEDIAEAAEWEGNANEFIEALETCGARGGAGFLERNNDGGLSIRDWFDYGGKLAVKREQDRERKARERKRNIPDGVTQAKTPPVSEILACPEAVRVTSNGQPLDDAGTSGLVTHIEKSRVEKSREEPFARTHEGSPPTAQKSAEQQSPVEEKDATRAIAKALEDNGVMLTSYMVEQYSDACQSYGIHAVLAGIRSAAENGKQQKLQYVMACIRNKAQGDDGRPAGNAPPKRPVDVTGTISADLARTILQ